MNPHIEINFKIPIKIDAHETVKKICFRHEFLNEVMQTIEEGVNKLNQGKKKINLDKSLSNLSNSSYVIQTSNISVLDKLSAPLLA
mgnify:CR=1 FL=1